MVEVEGKRGQRSLAQQEGNRTRQRDRRRRRQRRRRRVNTQPKTT